MGRYYYDPRCIQKMTKQIHRANTGNMRMLFIFFVLHHDLIPLLHRYSFCRINYKQLLKTLLEKEKLLITSNFSFSPQCFLLNQIIVSIFVHILISYLYLLLNWKSLNFAYHVKSYTGILPSRCSYI